MFSIYKYVKQGRRVEIKLDYRVLLLCTYLIFRMSDFQAVRICWHMRLKKLSDFQAVRICWHMRLKKLSDSEGEFQVISTLQKCRFPCSENAIFHVGRECLFSFSKNAIFSDKRLPFSMLRECLFLHCKNVIFHVARMPFSLQECLFPY